MVLFQHVVCILINWDNVHPIQGNNLLVSKKVDSRMKQCGTKMSLSGMSDSSRSIEE